MDPCDTVSGVVSRWGTASRRVVRCCRVGARPAGGRSMPLLLSSIERGCTLRRTWVSWYAMSTALRRPAATDGGCNGKWSSRLRTQAAVGDAWNSRVRAKGFFNFGTPPGGGEGGLGGSPAGPPPLAGAPSAPEARKIFENFCKILEILASAPEARKNFLGQKFF